MIERYLLKLRARAEVSAEEEVALRSAVSETRTFPPDHVFVRRGQVLSHSTLLLDGLLCRFKDLSNGQRQITELHVAGDFADLHSFTLKRLDHNLMTMTPCSVALVPHTRIAEIVRAHPRLGRLFWFSTNLDAAIHREWTLSLGRRSAISRMANLFCELQVRLHIVGLADQAGYDLPITQEELAECLGLTAVHVNRTIKELRDRNLVDFRGGRVRLIDLDGVQQIADFDPAYLYLDDAQLEQ